MFGPTGPTGPAGAQGPQGITGQYGIEGWRGFPGRPAKPIQLQIFQCTSDNLINTGRLYDYPITSATPPLSGNNSTTITGLSVTHLTPTVDQSGTYTDITIPAGKYYLEAAAGISHNVADAIPSNPACYLSLRDLCGNSNVITGTPTYAPNTGYFMGYISNNAASNYCLRQTLLAVPSGNHGLLTPLKVYGPGTLVNPQFLQTDYGGGNAPTGPPPTVTLTIMKIA